MDIIPKQGEKDIGPFEREFLSLCQRHGIDKIVFYYRDIGRNKQNTILQQLSNKDLLTIVLKLFMKVEDLAFQAGQRSGPDIRPGGLEFPGEMDGL